MVTVPYAKLFSSRSRSVQVIELLPEHDRAALSIAGYHQVKFSEEVALGNFFGSVTACKGHFRSVLGIRVEGVT